MYEDAHLEAEYEDRFDIGNVSNVADADYAGAFNYEDDDDEFNSYDDQWFDVDDPYDDYEFNPNNAY